VNKKIIFLLLFFLSGGLFLQLPKAFASTFTGAYVKLDNQTPNAALFGTVCAQPSSAGAGTENQVTIAFPDDFTVSVNPSDWTTDVSNLPSGATIWPSIGKTATGVSGQSVTFSSGDLTSTNLYCFNFTGASSTTGSTGSDKTGTITSKNSSNATIDSTTYAVSLLANNQIGINATVPPTASYLPISIESITTGNNFPQDTVLDYKITYGLLATVPFPLTIQAQWSQGIIQGSLVPSVDILDYVVGSASDAYDATPAVVDTVNRTITWTINSFPANTINQTLTFALKTNDAYTGDSSVSFDVSSRAISDSTVTPDQTITQNYLYNNASLVPTITVIPTPAPPSGMTTTPTPIPTAITPIIPQPLTFSGVSVYSISQSDAQISIFINNSSTLTINYGLTPSSLSKKIISLSPQTQILVDLPNLQPDSDYYFEVIAKDSSGNAVKSDIFTFRTAAVSEAPTVNTTTLVASSNNNILTSPISAAAATKKANNSTIVIPVASEFLIQFSLNKIALIKSVQAFIVNKNVLAANTFQSTSAGSNYVNLVEIRPGVYTGKLLSQPDPGNYEIYARIIDYSGNINIQKIADLNVVSKFKVLTKGTQQPIEDARILFYLYNSTSKTYNVISPSILPLTNPSFSLFDGTINITLPQGKYKTEISAIGYKNQTIEFAISPQSDYPTVYLTPSANLLTMAQYYLSTLSDAFISSQIFFQQQAQSSRLFDLTAIGGIIFLIGITILSISTRTHISVLYFPYFLYYKLIILFKRDKARILFGEVIDKKTEIPISRAKVYLSAPNGNHVLVSLVTNKLGEFYYKNPEGLDYKITVIKEGYSSSEPWKFINNQIKEIPKILKMEEQGKPHPSILEIITLYAEDFLGMLMEFLIIFGFFVQIYFILTFGIWKVILPLFITILNLILITVFLYKPRKLYD